MADFDFKVVIGFNNPNLKGLLQKKAQKVCSQGWYVCIRKPCAPGFLSHVDYLHLALTPKLLGVGENLLTGLDLVKLRYSVKESASGENATHVILERT